MSEPRINIPDGIKAGETFRVKTLISHPMHSGRLKDRDGKPIPRLILNRFECHFGETLVFACDLEPAMAQNPFIEFSIRLPGPGELRFLWIEDGGRRVEAKRMAGA
jgi:sulfur-oxidizing protein SoxZ